MKYVGVLHLHEQRPHVIEYCEIVEIYGEYDKWDNRVITEECDTREKAENALISLIRIEGDNLRKSISKEENRNRKLVESLVIGKTVWFCAYEKRIVSGTILEYDQFCDEYIVRINEWNKNTIGDEGLIREVDISRDSAFSTKEECVKNQIEYLERELKYNQGRVTEISEAISKLR